MDEMYPDKNFTFKVESDVPKVLSAELYGDQP